MTFNRIGIFSSICHLHSSVIAKSNFRKSINQFYAEMLPFLQVQVLPVYMVQRPKQLLDFVEYFLAQLLFQQLVQLPFVVSTLISLINVEPTLTNFEKFHPPQKKKSPLLVY